MLDRYRERIGKINRERDVMGEFGVASPCVSYSYITINGQNWGIYLNVEDIDESFLERNYGKEYGNLYKPETEEVVTEAGQMPPMGEGVEKGQMPPMGEGVEKGQMPPRRKGIEKDNVESLGADFKYTDNAFESYANIFDNAETKITDEDKTELIAKFKQLSEGKNLEEVLDIEALSRYFVAHNFLLNDDSYTGTMLHHFQEPQRKKDQSGGSLLIMILIKNNIMSCLVRL